MNKYTVKLLTSTMMPLLVGIGVATVSLAVAPKTPLAAAKKQNPCAAKKAACNPCAAKGKCNPCAAKKGCGACNPCNPCAATKGCGACNPCAGGMSMGASGCLVPRLAKANPCAAKKGCGACNPCNPCAATKSCGACNPCAAKKGGGACNPCAAKKGCGACNPCNPCAAQKGCNPCNPCGACNPCNPCAGGSMVEVSDDEAQMAYDCMKGKLSAAYGKSGLASASAYGGWKRYNRVPYISATHGGRYVNNYANAKGDAYGKFEKSGTMPAGTVLAKDSFTVAGNGAVSPGPFFTMEKMPAGFRADANDWRYTLVMPNGAVFGTTSGEGSRNVEFCIECHSAVAEDQDQMFFIPEEYRAKGK